MNRKDNGLRYISLISVSIGSKIMFMIPYIMSVYYVVFQNATGFSNSQIGLLMTVLGISSFCMFIPGGYLADKLPIKFSVSVGLIGCGVIGIYLLLVLPSFATMLRIYALIPIFITLLTWNSAMKAIRMLGTDKDAGKNQTIRSLSISVVSISIAIFVIIFLSFSSNDLMAYKILMGCYSIIVIACGIIFALTFKPVIYDNKDETINLKDFIAVLKIKEVWLIGVFGSVVYLTQISLTYLQPYLAEVYNLDSTTTSILGAICRDISLISVPIMIWFAANRKTSLTRVIAIGLTTSAICFIAFLVMPANDYMILPSIMFFLIAAFWIMGSWLLQFVPLTEIKFPLQITGSAIGIISVIVHLGDIFYYSVCGMLIDTFASKGYQLIFLITILFLVIGITAAIKLANIIDNISKESSKFGERSMKSDIQ